eukprot:357442-Chlamydomonas_euryale.AAC.6
MDEDCLPWHVFDFFLAGSVAEDGRVEQVKLRPGHRATTGFLGTYSSAIRAYHEEGSCGGTTFWNLLKLPGHIKVIPWPEIQAAAAEVPLDSQAWRDAIKSHAPEEFKKPQQVGRMTRSCAHRGGSGYCCATLSSVRPGSRGVLLIQVWAWLMVLIAMIVTWRRKMRKLLHLEKPSVRWLRRQRGFTSPPPPPDCHPTVPAP